VDDHDGTPPLVVYADGPGSSACPPEVVAAAAGLPPGPVDVLLGWTVDAPAWLDHRSAATTATMLGGYGLTPHLAAGHLRYLPTRLSAMGRLLAGPFRPAVAVVAGVRRGDGFAFRTSPGWGVAAAEQAAAVVVAVADEPDLGGPAIPGRIVATVAGGEPIAAPATPAPGPVEAAIAGHVAALVPDGATVEYGAGALPDAVVRALDRPVSIRTGLATDAVVALAERRLLRGPVVAAYLWGGRALHDMAAAGDLLRVPVSETHDPVVLTGVPRFVAVNTALQVGLDGTVNVERVGGRIVAGIGGHADFCLGASRSDGGVSVVVLAAARRGRSSIVAQVDVASTPRCDVGVVVTEHGIADLRGLDDAARAVRLVAIAAPEHRAELERSLR
jgi:acyl CoA:acetate/3-ketoacid CoA transferase beta subunit